MKRYLFIIGLWATCFALPNTLPAQWGFTVTQRESGNCKGCDNIQITVVDFGSIPVNGFPTRQDCEYARQYLAGISQSFACGCTLYLNCSACMGRDLVFPGTENETDIGSGINISGANTSGTSRGNAFYSGNPGEAVQDAYDQKNLQNEVLFGEVAQNENTAQYLLTDDKDFNGYIAKVLPKGDIDWGNVKPVIPAVPSLSDDMNNRPPGTKTLADYSKEAERKLSELMHPSVEEATKGPKLFSTDDRSNALLGEAQDHIFDKVKDIANNVFESSVNAISGSRNLAQRIINFKETLVNISAKNAIRIFRDALDVPNNGYDIRQMDKHNDQMFPSTLRKINEGIMR
ncbi:MAG: hypothetical protein LBK97_01340 [Prevotellaceae bacterium]|jgi:hypothetical protein|nr:hypothetical protein [Prevotellaceae bacterium]